MAINGYTTGVLLKAALVGNQKFQGMMNVPPNILQWPI